LLYHLLKKKCTNKAVINYHNKFTTIKNHILLLEYLTACSMNQIIKSNNFQKKKPIKLISIKKIEYKNE